MRLGAAAVAEARSGAVRDKALAAVVEEGGCGCVRCCSDVRSAFFWFAHKMRAVMATQWLGVYIMLGIAGSSVLFAFSQLQ